MLDRLEKRLEEMGQPDLLDKIATEKDAVSVDELVEFLQKVEHPALAMASVLG
jgi:acetyl-CoA synthase